MGEYWSVEAMTEQRGSGGFRVVSASARWGAGMALSGVFLSVLMEVCWQAGSGTIQFAFGLFLKADISGRWKGRGELWTGVSVSP